MTGNVTYEVKKLTLTALTLQIFKTIFIVYSFCIHVLKQPFFINNLPKIEK